jgi:peptide/nickel transport system permease protein
MVKTIVYRAIQFLFVAWAVATLMFFVMRLSGDPARLIAGIQASEEQVETIRKRLGFDRPNYVQYLVFLRDLTPHLDEDGNFKILDFGDSFSSREPAINLVAKGIIVTGQLSGLAFLIAVILAIPVGVLAAVHRGKWRDWGIVGLTLIGQSMPHFWLGLLLILFFSVQLDWFPAFGWESPSSWILPALTLSAYPLARFARMIRADMIEVLAQDYVRTARSKGLSENTVRVRHALRNALLPTVTIMGFDLATIFGGSLIVENVFAVPGIGNQMIIAMNQRDIPVVQAIVFVVALVTVSVNLIVDFSYRYLDPRTSN